MTDHEARQAPPSLVGQASRAYSGLIGQTYPAGDLPKGDLLLDRSRWPSEGLWAFCSFDSEEIPAIRMGFQRGGFNIGADPRPPDPSLLQLHLEVMTEHGGLLWLPTGVYPADQLRTKGDRVDIRLQDGQEWILGISGWPNMDWHIRSSDSSMEVRLSLAVETAILLPDARLPHATFAMWVATARVFGDVRVGARAVALGGLAVLDRPRIIDVPHHVAPRTRYLYTTMHLDGGGSFLGYHAEDVAGRPIVEYCFGVLVDRAGDCHFLTSAETGAIALDADGIPERWHLDWRGDGFALDADIVVRPMPLTRAWGSPGAPATRGDYVIFPLVLHGDVRVRGDGQVCSVRGRGLAEYYDAEAWPRRHS